MGSIRKELLLDVPAAEVWDAVRDYGAVHQRMAPGVLTDTRVEDGARIVTFANGLVLHELIVDLDDAQRRLVWAAVRGRATHHNGVMQVFAEGEARCRLVWTTDFLPNELARDIDGLMELSLQATKKNLERRHARA
jgi:Polyketide cyclase / dehydrase and lipid transport